MRIKSKWHDSSSKSIKDIATALSFNTWRLTKNSLEDLINEAFVIEKDKVFDVIVEYACFIIQCIDRLSYPVLSNSDRTSLITYLVEQVALYYQENKAERIKDGNYQKEFVAIYNQRAKDYANFGFDKSGPDYSFYRYFGEQIKNATTAADEKWIAQQMIEIQAPKAFKILKNNFNNTLTSVVKIEENQTKKPETPREIRRKARRAKKGLEYVSANKKIMALYQTPS